MSNKRLILAAIFASAIFYPGTNTLGQELRRVQFQSTDQEFLNPERGFYRYRNLDQPTNFDSIRDAGQTLIYGRVEASDFRDRPLSEEFLNKIQSGFDEAREQGLKVKFRLAYNNGFEPDAPKDVILNHIEQLKPVWEKNSDVMFHMDAGFIGAWGEWHASTNGLDNFDDRKEILFAILDALPKDRTVGLRYPNFKRKIFTGSQLSDEGTINEENAFDGSKLSRVGHLNDCFLSSENDVGTYSLLENNWPIEREIKYIGEESLYVPFGGETCALDDRGKSENAIAEMTKLHIDYLNLDYHPDVINRWKEEGSFEEIQRRLGYRLSLKEAELPAELRPGGLMEFKITIENTGFGELFNPRSVEVTLRHEDGTQHSAPLNVDPRRWSGGETNKVDTWLVLPDSLPIGKYSVGIWLPDAAKSLREDVRYAIRFANEGVWNEDTGVNHINDLVVSNSAAGKVYSSSSFQEVTDRDSLGMKGDFDSNGVLDELDIDLLSSNLGSKDLTFDLTGDLVVDEQDRTVWVEQLARTDFGDADLNGKVEFADFLLLSASFGGPGGWAKGNFDGNGDVDFADFLLLSENFGTDNTQASEATPESSNLLPLVCVGGSMLLRRRRGKRIK